MFQRLENKDVELAFVSVPKGNKQYGLKGRLFAIVARMPEEPILWSFKRSAVALTTGQRRIDVENSVAQDQFGCTKPRREEWP